MSDEIRTYECFLLDDKEQNNFLLTNLTYIVNIKKYVSNKNQAFQLKEENSVVRKVNKQ